MRADNCILQAADVFSIEHMSIKAFCRYMAQPRMENKICWTENYKPYRYSVHEIGALMQIELKQLQLQLRAMDGMNNQAPELM